MNSLTAYYIDILCTNGLPYLKVRIINTTIVFVDKFGGGSPDWARGVANVTYSYLIELRDRGYYGFLLPEDQILATGEEVWEGVRVILDQVRYDRYGSGQEFNDTYYHFLQEEDFLFRLTKTFPAKWQGVYGYAGWSLAHSSTPVANCCCLYVLLVSLISSCFSVTCLFC